MTNKKYQVQTYVDCATKEKIDQLCAKYQESVSSIMRRAIIKFLEQEDKGNAWFQQPWN